jgi:hypothetical protein
MTSKQELERNYTSMANWALILSILSWIILGIILAPTSLVLGAKALNSKSGGTRAIATIAIIIGAVATAVLVISFMIGIAAVSMR